MVKAVAWVAILVASNLATVVWRLAFHREPPLWNLGARIAILALLYGKRYGPASHLGLDLGVPSELGRNPEVP